MDQRRALWAAGIAGVIMLGIATAPQADTDTKGVVADADPALAVQGTSDADFSTLNVEVSTNAQCEHDADSRTCVAVAVREVRQEGGTVTNTLRSPTTHRNLDEAKVEARRAVDAWMALTSTGT